MPSAPSWPDDLPPLALLTRGIDTPAGEDARRLAAFLVRAFGPATAALIHYGSHAQASGTGPDSAWDFFVIVDDYRAAYRSLAPALRPGFPAARAAWLNRILPPNVIAVTCRDAEPALLSKCCVLSLGDLARACSRAPRDHFVRARLFQHVQLIWTRDPAAAGEVTSAIALARGTTCDWARPFLPARFDATAYARTLLDVSYRAEIRPEGGARIEALLSAQAETLLPVVEGVMSHLADRGRLARDGAAYRDPRRPGAVAVWRARAWFGWSKARATLRWAKYVALYDDWLDYVVRKVERRAGQTMVLTPRERRWPLLFLWPRLFRFLGRRPGTEA